VYTNNEWKGRYELNVTRDKDGNMGVCYTRDMLERYGISAEKLNPQLSQQEGYCGRLKEWRNEENVKDNLIQSSLRLEVSVPQIYEDQRLKNFVSPEFWDKGIAALNLGWMANTWTSHSSAANGSDNSSAYLGVNAGLSWDGWLLKHIGNLNWQQQQGKRTGTATRPIFSARSRKSTRLSAAGRYLPTANSSTPSACVGSTCHR
jgi:outer membrane usher protein